MRLNLGRIFANAIARRVAYVVVAAVLAWCGLGKAHAQATYSDQGAAYAGCKAGAAVNRANVAFYDADRCTFSPNISNLPGYRCEVRNGSSGVWVTCSFYGSLGGPNHRYPAAQNCAAKPNYVGSPPASTAVGVVRNGSFTCMGGCKARWAGNGDGTFTATFSHLAAGVCSTPELQQDCQAIAGVGMHWNAWIQACEPTPTACTGNQVKDPATGECKEACPVGMVVNPDGQCDPEADSCPAGQIKSPAGGCLPGEGQCAAGEAKRPDGTCGKDANGDGVADDDDDDPDNDSEKNTFSGGEGCNSPPSCSGDPIMCGQARIQWRIDCNTRKNRSISGGGCAAMPVCVGEDCDAMEHAQLIVQWRTACALENLSPGGGGGDDGTADWLSAQAQQNKADADAIAAGGDGHSDVNPSDLFHQNTGANFNPNLFGGSSPGTCSFESNLTIGGRQIEIPAMLFTILAGVGWLIVAIAYLRVGTLVARAA